MKTKGVSVHNNKCLAYNPYAVPPVMKFLQTLMPFGCVSSEGGVILTRTFEQGFRLKSNRYVELLNIEFKPWIEWEAAG